MSIKNKNSVVVGRALDFRKSLYPVRDIHLLCISAYITFKLELAVGSSYTMIRTHESSITHLPFLPLEKM